MRIALNKCEVCGVAYFSQSFYDIAYRISCKCQKNVWGTNLREVAKKWNDEMCKATREE